MAPTTQTILIAQAAAPSGAEAAATAAATAGSQAAEATTEQVVGFPPFDATTFPSSVLWLVISFGVLYFVVARAVQPRLTGILTARREKIDGDLAEADRLRQATDQAIHDYEAALSAARARAHGLAEETRNASRAELEAKRAAVEAELAEKMREAEASIQKAKVEALGKVDEIATDTAAALVERLIGAVPAEETRAAVASVKG